MKRNYSNYLSPNQSPRVINEKLYSSLDYDSNYYIKNGDNYFIGLNDNDNIIYDGAIDIIVIKGNIIIQGYNLLLNKLYSIASNSSLSSSIPIISISGKSKIIKNKYEKIYKELSKYSTIINIKKCSNKILFDKNVKTQHPFNIPGFKIYLQENPLIHEVEIYPQLWKNTIKDITDNFEKPRIALLGSKVFII